MWKYYLLLLLQLPISSFAQKADSSRRIAKDTLKMQDVVVSTKVAVKISGDTISYNVDSLTKNPNATSEDVLKKLPGVEITSDGKILVNGKEVTKIFINGKLYTSADIRALTQNLPAEILEKMQLADWYDEDAQFSGIKKGSTEKMLNLKIKKDYERGMYGQAIAGLGTKNTYQAGTFTNYMSSDTRVTIIAKLNNTGLSDVGITSSGNADNTKASTPNATGITKRRMADISFSNDNGGKLKTTGSYNAWFIDNNQQQTSLRNTYLPGDSLLLQKTNRTINNITYNHRLNLKTDWAIDSFHSNQTDIGLSYRKNNSDSRNVDGTYYNTTDNISFNRNANITTSGEGYGLSISNVLRKRFKKIRRTASVSINIVYNKDENTGDNFNLNEYYNPPTVGRNDFVSTEDKNTISTKVGLNYNEPIRKYHTISFSYYHNFNLNENDRSVWFLNNGIRFLDTIQSRENDVHNSEHSLSLAYQFFKEEKIRFNLQIDAQPFLRSISLSGYSKASKLSQNGINYSPALFARYDFNKHSNLSIHYNVGIRMPELTQLQVIPDYRDSLNIMLGNPNLRSETRNTVYLNYSQNTKDSRANFWFTTNANWIYNKTVNNIVITASKRITTPTNANGFFSININTGYNKKVYKWLGVSVSANVAQNNNIVITNDKQQIIPNKNAGGSLRFVLTINDWYEGEVNYNYRINSIANPIGNINTLQTHTLSTTGTCTLPYQIRFIYYINYMHNEGLAVANNPDFILVNATIEKAFTKPKGLFIRIQGFDIFNNYPNVQRTFGDNFYEDREANRLGRFFMFSLIYKFTYFPGKNKSM